MNYDERIAWVKTLKVGDVVGVESWEDQDQVWEKHTVKRITPTGRIKLDDGSDFGTRGVMDSGQSVWYRKSYTLVPWEDRFDVAMAHRKLVGRVLHYLDLGAIDQEKVRGLSDEKLTEMLTLLRTVRKPTLPAKE